MTKEQIKHKYTSLVKKNGGNPISLDTFISVSGIGRRQINREFGTYTKLKAECDFNESQPKNTGEKSSLKNISDKEAIIEVNTYQITSLEELLERCKVNQDIWSVKNFIVNKWDVGAKNSEGKIETKALFQVKAWLEKQVQKENLEKLLENFVTEASKHSPKEFKIKNNTFSSEKLLLLNLPDFHFGKLCWAEETGGHNYDLKKAVRIFKETIDNLLAKVKNYSSYEKILFIVGNDLINSDNLVGTTTAGTPQDNDGRWFKTYKTVCSLVSETIEKLSQYAQVDVLMAYGNHDTTTCLTMGEYLKAWFRNNKNVNVLNSPASRKYYQYGKNAFCITHGNETKHTELPLTMATECTFWNECTNREILLGHYHQNKVSENKGVKIRIFPSLSATDNWHSSKSYIGNKRIGQALVYSTKGMDAIFEYEPDFSQDL